MENKLRDIQELPKQYEIVFKKFPRILGISIILMAFVVTFLSRVSKSIPFLNGYSIYIRLITCLISIFGIWVANVWGWKIMGKNIEYNESWLQEAVNRYKKTLLFRFSISEAILVLGFLLFLCTGKELDFYIFAFVGLFGFFISSMIKPSKD